MKIYSKKKFLCFGLIINFFLYFCSFSLADNHNIYETLEQIQKDIKTLEKAVYSSSTQLKSDTNTSSNTDTNNYSEDILTRHLLKLSEIENQFQQLTNKFEEINFKLDKLSNRMSKVQDDNQIRFQDFEEVLSSGDATKKVKKKNNDNTNELVIIIITIITIIIIRRANGPGRVRPSVSPVLECSTVISLRAATQGPRRPKMLRSCRADLLPMMAWSISTA